MGTRAPRIGLGLFVALAAAIAIVALPATASARDRNHDRIPDRWEKHFHLSLKVNQAHRDQDRDGLRNRQEFLAGTSPRSADTDDDNVPDDEENAGTIASFDGTTLTIDLFSGGSVSGTVTPDTEVKCESREDTENGDDGGSGGDEKIVRDHGGDNSGPGGDDSGPGGDDDGPGDDDNDQNEDPTCTTADLTPGTVVHEAEIDVTSTGSVFEEVDLVANTLGGD